MNKWLHYKLLGWLQSKCEHPSETVSADILEGCSPDSEVKWCRICGAYAVHYKPHHLPPYWTAPRANWWIKP